MLLSLLLLLTLKLLSLLLKLFWLKMGEALDDGIDAEAATVADEADALSFAVSDRSRLTRTAEVLVWEAFVDLFCDEAAAVALLLVLLLFMLLGVV